MSDGLKLIVGLGNPGREHRTSRHNVGWMVVDRLGERWNIDMSRERFHGWFGEGDISGWRVGLLKPLTYMNRSGQAALAAVQFYKLDGRDFLLVTDDMYLPLGRLRLRVRGSAGGHNGLTDVIDRLGTEEFARLRVGIGGHEGNMVGHVLSAFSAEQMPAARAAVDRAADAVECWVAEGAEQTMNRFNAPVDPEVKEDEP